MGAPIGNTNSSSKNRIVSDTLRKVAKQNPKKLRKACETLLNKAEEGDISAFKEFTDRLEGKSAQTIQGTGENGSFNITITKDDTEIL